MTINQLIEEQMKYLLLVCAVFALLVAGCGEEAVVRTSPNAHSNVEVKEVGQIELDSILASNDLTLVDFTAVW